MTDIYHGPFRCTGCEQRVAAEQAASEKGDIVASLSDAALAALADAIAEVYEQTRPPR